MNQRTIPLLCAAVLALWPLSHMEAQEAKQKPATFEYIGKAVQKKGTHVWGSSPVIGKDGKVLLYVAEWPVPQDKAERFSGWFKHCSIAHYVGDSPEGPFKFVRIAVADRNGSFNAPHNPTIKLLDGKYVLCFIVNENDDTSKQRIVMYVADDLNDEWRPAKGGKPDGTILSLPTDKAIWSNRSARGVTNPSLIKHNGKYLLYYKSVIVDPANPKDFKGWDFGYGVASSGTVEGPYTFHPDRITSEGLQLEDVSAFTADDQVYLLSRDIRGSLGSRGGGLLWKSKSGLRFDSKDTVRAFEDLAAYLGRQKLAAAKVYRGDKDGHLERPQLLFTDDGRIYMYVATGINTSPGHGSASHVFRVRMTGNGRTE